MSLNIIISTSKCELGTKFWKELHCLSLLLPGKKRPLCYFIFIVLFYRDLVKSCGKDQQQKKPYFTVDLIKAAITNAVKVLFGEV